MIPSLERLNELFSYDPDSGVIKWKKSTNRRIKPGDVAGSFSSGYLQIGVDGVSIFAHRIAYALGRGKFPDSIIDHINGDRADNRLENLRLADKSLNAHNTSKTRGPVGMRGVGYDSKREKFTARITINGAHVWLGYHETKEAAKSARDEKLSKSMMENKYASAMR
jgi:hypothetical protein